MASQFSNRLRYSRLWLQQASRKVQQLGGESPHSWFFVAAFFGGSVASASFLVSEQQDEYDNPHLREDSTRASILQDAQNAVFLPKPTIPKNSLFIPAISYTNCEGKVASRFSLFGRQSRLRRSSTIVQYQNEVSKESVRSRYRVNWKKPLGEGGFGAVYSAVDRKTGEKVALKQISKKYTDTVGFQREMEALLHLRRHGGHPNICG